MLLINAYYADPTLSCGTRFWEGDQFGCQNRSGQTDFGVNITRNARSPENNFTLRLYIT